MSVYSGGGSSGGRNRKRSLRQELKRVENSIYELELSYFQQVTRGGNAFEGWYSEPRPVKRQQQQPVASDEDDDDDERTNGVDPEIVEKMLRPPHPRAARESSVS